VRLTITDLRPRTTYFYAVAARDNVSGRAGPRSPTTKTRTRR
jgi:phosphodiesterase/alkaline phosphatase D-like protein